MIKNITMRFPLEGRVRVYARRVRKMLSEAGMDIRHPDTSQLIRASGSVGANYIEANEAVSQKDRQLRLRIARKEAREAGYWLDVIVVNNKAEPERIALIKETDELSRILSTILQKIS